MRKLFLSGTLSLFLASAIGLPLWVMSVTEQPVYCATMMFMQDPQNPPTDGEEQTEPGQSPPDDTYEGNPTHTMPATFCTPFARKEQQMPCMCTKMAKEGCHNGKREVEHKSCNSWCWKSLCRCCSN